MDRTAIKVFTPIKRIPIMIGKSQSGQKLPLGPYTLAQIVGGTTLRLFTSMCVMVLPVNAVITFGLGLVFTVLTMFGLGMVPHTGVRLTSRMRWITRLILVRTPVSASGMPTDPDTSRVVFIDESIVILLPDRVRHAVR